MPERRAEILPNEPPADRHDGRPQLSIQPSRPAPHPARRRRAQRAVRALRPALRDRRLSGRRRGDRAVRAALFSTPESVIAGGRARRRDAAVPDRARAGALAAARDAARHFRPRRRSTVADRRGDRAGSRSRPGLFGWRARWSPASRSRCRRPRSRCACWRSAATCSSAYGQRAFAILLFQDMAVVPLLALAAAAAPAGRARAPAPGRGRGAPR